MNRKTARFGLGRVAALLAAALTAVALLALPSPAAAAGGARLSVDDAQLVETHAGYAYLVFKVRLANATGRPVRVRYETRDGTATAPSDYGPAKGEVSFRGTTVRKKVFVPVFGDTTAEPNETFKLVLSHPDGARISDAVATGTIVNDDETLTVTRTGTGTGVVSSAGIDCGSDCTETYARGTQVTLTAAPETGSAFEGWSGGGCSGTGTCTVTLTQAVNITAAFALQQHTLSVTRTGTGNGVVSGTGINCGSHCTETYTYGTMVTLTATPGTGSTFTGWSGACTGTGTCTVTITQATAVTATFTLQEHMLTVSRAGTGNGVVSGTGINCGSQCTETYIYGTMVTLTATPEAGSTFAGWNGACTGTGSCTVTMTQSRSVAATFSPS